MKTRFDPAGVATGGGANAFSANDARMALTDGNNTAVGFAGEVTLAAGEYFEIFAWQNSGSTLTMSPVPTFIDVNRLYNDSTPTGIVRAMYQNMSSG